MTEFFKKLFSESGEASYSRFASFVALIFSIIWVSYELYHVGHIPSMEGPIAFPVTMYGVGKGGETIQKFMGKDGGQRPPLQQ